MKTTVLALALAAFASGAWAQSCPWTKTKTDDRTVQTPVAAPKPVG
jgi:hypothetical protein